MSAFTVYAIFAVVIAVTVTVTAIEQPDEVGPAGMFEKSVSEMMARNENMTRDVAEMLVAAESLGNAKATENVDSDTVAMTEKLNRALTAMDEVQKTAADVYDRSYDDFLDLYPAWRMYLLCDDPKHKKALLRSYKSLLARYNTGRKALIRDLGVLMALEKALLPSNAYPDPDNRIPASDNTAAVLENF
uniref:Prolyl 4-hydroxylase subunit alpha-2 n=1 Tax=Schizaphis graminum TaxID=13262 RepID=A0A2S2PAQ3_SCHGA